MGKGSFAATTDDSDDAIEVGAQTAIKDGHNKDTRERMQRKGTTQQWAKLPISALSRNR
jgi:hypothetical protein